MDIPNPRIPPPVLVLISGATATFRTYRGALDVGQLIGPRGGSRVWADRWAADNDCFNGFDPGRFVAMLTRRAGVPGCLWVAAPDVVCDFAATLARFAEWEPAIRAHGYPVALVLQNGAESMPIPWERLDAVFVGGDDAWKESAAVDDLAGEARSRGKLVHMGRVNSRRRFRFAWEIGCDSVDGTGWSKFPDVYAGRGSRWAGEIRRDPFLFGRAR